MGNCEHRPVGKNLRLYPYALAPYIESAGITSSTFCERIPLFLNVSAERLFKGWVDRGFPNNHPFLFLLGTSEYHDGKPKLNLQKELSSFNLWLDSLLSSQSKPKEEISYTEFYNRLSQTFEARVSTQLINFFINRISGFSLQEESWDVLAGLLTGIQIVSTNRITSPDYVIEYLDLLRKKNFLFLLPYYLHELFIWKFKDEKGRVEARPNNLSNNIIRLFHNHLSALFTNYESGFRVPNNLLKSFFAILDNKDNKSPVLDTRYGVQERNTEFSKLAFLLDQNPNQYFPNKDKRAQILIRYFYGLEKVAEAIVKGKHNGNLYLSDHLKRVMEAHGLWPENPDELSEEQWEEKLTQCLEYPEFLDFLRPEEVVREVEGRYDYRALFDYLQAKKIKLLPRVISLGFGRLGIASFELLRELGKRGISVNDFHGVDILPLEPINLPPDRFSITKYLRNSDGTFQDLDHDGIVGTEILDPERVEEIIDWYNQNQKEGKLKGNIDLTSPTAFDGIELPQADLVTLQGTLGCIDDLSKHVVMIKNALKLVNPNGGILLIEGGMTFYGGQNVNSIAIRLIDGKVEIIYLDIVRTKDYKFPVHYTSSNCTLMGNQDVLPEDKKNNIGGTNYQSVPFSDPYKFIPTLFDAINRKNVSSK